MAVQIRLRRGTATQWTSANPVLAVGEAGYETDTRKLKVGDGTTAWSSLPYFVGNLPGGSLNDLGDVTITDAANGDFLRWNGTAWVNDAVNLGTDTIGNYVVDIAGGTGVTVTHTPGEASTASIAIGQAVGTSSSVTFAAVTAPLIGNADTASTLQNARTISISGDVSGSVSFNGSANVDISATIQPNSVALGTDTTGNYVNDVVSGTGVTVTHTPGEGSSASIAIGQDVATNASVQFAQVTTTGDVTVGGNLTVNGTTTTLNTETLAIEDNIVLLNSNVTGSPSTNAGIEVERGDSSNVVLRWNESTDSWEVTEDGSTYKNIAVGQDVETSSSVTFAAVTASTFTGNLVGNADTASQLATARTISLSGDLSGSVSFSGSTDVTLNATVVDSGVSLDEISDVIITSPEEFQGLSYNGTNWVNSHIPLVSYVQNAEATTITTGTCVYLFGGTGDHASVKRADNSTDTTSSKTVGVAGANIAASQNGPVVTRGYVDGIDLSIGYSPGDVLWLGENGAFTTTKPSAPEHLVFIGVVVRATNNGIIYVATQNGYELEELHDVKISSPQNNDFLKYNSASAIWVNDPINLGTDTVGNYMTDVVAGTNISITHTPGEGSSASIAVVGSPTFDSLLARQSVGVGFDPLGSGQVVWYGSTDQPGRLQWNPSALRDIYLPDAGGTVALTSASTGIVALGTDTTGNYMTDVVAGTGVAITHTPGEGSSASIAIGQDVSSSAEVTFERVNIGGRKIAFEGDTANDYETTLDAVDPTADRTIYIPDASGTIALTSGSTGVVTLGTDTAGNYVADVVAGTNISITHTPGEGSSASIAIDPNPAFSGTVGASAYFGNVFRAYDGGEHSWMGPEDHVGSLYWSPSQTRTINIPDANGTIAITSSSTGIVALGADTTGNYMADVAGGTGVTISHTPGEGSTASISIGQAVATSSSVTFAQVTSSVVTILGTPSNSTDAVTKQYVDQVAAGIDWHESVALTTAAALPNTPTYDNGSSGSGATLTAGANARLVIDGTNATTGTRVLIKDQANAVHNGVYVVTEQGSVSIPWVLTRAEDFDGDTGHEIYGGEAVFTTGGTNNIRQGFTVTSAGSGTAGAHEFGTDSVTFTQFTGTAAFTAGSGLTQSGNSIDVATASSTRIVVNSDSIDLATVTQTDTSGTAGTSFVQSHTVDSYGRLTGTITADVQDASTSAKGIARFNSGQFSVSSGSVSIASGAITSTQIANGTIVNSDVSETAGIALMKLQYGTSGQMIVAASDGMPTWQTITGDISVNASGVATIAANSVALGTDTTGNYLVNVVAQPGLVITHTPGEGSTASIGLDSVIASSNSGASGTNFISAITVDGYGRVTAYTASDVQDASTSAKGIAQFNSSHFSVSSGSVSLPQSIATTASPTFASASITDQLNAASATIRLKYSTNQAIIAMNGSTSSSTDVFKIVNNYDMGNVAHTSAILMRDSSDMSTVAGMLFRQTASVAGIEFGPRVLIDSTSGIDPMMSLTETAAASVALYVDRHTSGSVGMVLKDSMSSSVNMLEWRDSSGTAYGSIGGNSASYRFNATSASLQSASTNALYLANTTNPNTPGFAVENPSSFNTRITLQQPGATFGSVGAATWLRADQSSFSIQFAYESASTTVIHATADSGTGLSTITIGSASSTVVLPGNLRVDGTTTTVNSTTITVDDPIFTLGGDTAPTSDDNKDRGIEFRYYSGTAASVGFMGYDDSTGRFVFLTGATNTSEVFSGTAASVEVGSLFIQVAGGGVHLHGLSSTPTVKAEYSASVYATLEASMSGPAIRLNYNGSEGVIAFDNASSRFTFSRAILSASLASASINAPVLSGSIHYDSSASVTLPSKTFFPEEYLSVSSSVTLNSTTHRYATLEMTASAGTSVITVPADASDNFPVGSVIQIIRVGAGEVQVTASAGVTVNNALGSRLRVQWSTATLRKRAANTWLLSGDLKV